MSLYEDRFDADWDALDRDEAVERAFALGVAARLGEPDVEEFKTVRAEMSSNYDESLVELAYQEGRRKASERKQAVENAGDRDVWEWVISEELENVRPPDPDDADRATDLPSVVSDLPEATDRPDPDPEQTDFPEFLE